MGCGLAYFAPVYVENDVSVYWEAKERVDNPQQVDNLPHIAASRKQFWRLSEGVRCWMIQILNASKGETPCNSFIGKFNAAISRKLRSIDALNQIKLAAWKFVAAREEMNM